MQSASTVYSVYLSERSLPLWMEPAVHRSGLWVHDSRTVHSVSTL